MIRSGSAAWGHMAYNFKTVKKRKYCYFQTSEPGGISRQLYIGPADLKIESIIAKYQVQKDAFKSENKNIARLCAQLRIGGANVTLRAWDALKVRGKSFIKREEAGLLRLSKEYPDIFRQVKAVTSE